MVFCPVRAARRSSRAVDRGGVEVLRRAPATRSAQVCAAERELARAERQTCRDRDRSVSAGARAAKRPIRGRAKSASATPSAAIATRTSVSIAMYH